jgi:poly(3-hydroxyalkanoate) synthetase
MLSFATDYALQAFRPIERPKYATENEIVFENLACALRCYSREGQTPTVLIVPKAGHTGQACDLSERNSLVRTLMESGLSPFYLLEGKEPSPGKPLNLDGLITADKECLGWIGEPVNLIGICQGGVEATILSAVHPGLTASLTVALAPINTGVGGGYIQDVIKYVPEGYFRQVVNFWGGVYPSFLQIWAFKLMHPERHFFSDYFELLNVVGDRVAEERRNAFRNWYETGQDIPAWMLDVLPIFYDNALIAGSLKVNGEPVNLRRISCPLVLVAGSRDDITPPEQTLSMSRFVSTPTGRIHKYLVDGGHFGGFMGSGALKTVWPDVARTIIAEAGYDAMDAVIGVMGG